MADRHWCRCRHLCNYRVLLLGAPQWGVWSQTLEGEAQLKKTEFTRQIAKLDADAEIARAKGVAEANRIIADGLGGPNGYLTYL